MRETVKYEIKDGNEWIKCLRAQEDWRKGWLRYELKDGTNGLARPGTWRVAETSQKQAGA